LHKKGAWGGLKGTGQKKNDETATEKRTSQIRSKAKLKGDETGKGGKGPKTEEKKFLGYLQSWEGGGGPGTNQGGQLLKHFRCR